MSKRRRAKCYVLHEYTPSGNLYWSRKFRTKKEAVAEAEKVSQGCTTKIEAVYSK